MSVMHLPVLTHQTPLCIEVCFTNSWTMTPVIQSNCAFNFTTIPKDLTACMLQPQMLTQNQNNKLPKLLCINKKRQWARGKLYTDLRLKVCQGLEMILTKNDVKLVFLCWKYCVIIHNNSNNYSILLCLLILFILAAMWCQKAEMNTTISSGPSPCLFCKSLLYY